MRSRFLLTLLGFGCIVAAVQAAAFRRAPLVVSPEWFQKAHLLRSSSAWHFGYLPGHHGARLVRTRNLGMRPASAAVSDDELHSTMREALDSLPRKAALEGAFYVALLTLAMAAARGVSRLRALFPQHRLRVVAASGLAAIALLFAFLTPSFFLGYGGSAFSTWTGPGALSASSGHLSVLTVPGETVSYRYAVELTLYSSLWYARQSAGLSYGDDHSMPVLILLELLPASLHSSQLPFRVLFLGSAAVQAFFIGALSGWFVARPGRAS